MCRNKPVLWFRDYSPASEVYISQDSIGLKGNMPNFYSHVSNRNVWVDTFGLYSDLSDTGMGYHLMPRSIAKQLGITELSPNNAIA